MPTLSSLDARRNLQPAARGGPAETDKDRVIASAVEHMLAKSQAWRALPQRQQREIATHTAAVVKTMAETRRGSRPVSTDPYDMRYAVPLADSGSATPGAGSARSQTPKVGDVINAGVDAAARMVNEIDFPAFVASLIEGTFHAIVKSSIEQMQAYADMVKSVSQSLNEFRDQNVSENQGRDHLVSKYPQFLQVNVQNGKPTVGAKPEADLDNMPDFQKDMGLSEPVGDLDDETIENVLVPAARDQLAIERQKLLATIILMGINRIIVTDGKINAKIRFQFSAQENTQTRAQSFDYQNMGDITTSEGQSEYQRQGEQVSQQGGYTGTNIYATGQYKTTTSPDVRVTSQVDTTSTGALQASGQIMGEVSVNFRSETFPLEKMVNTDQMLQLQQAQRGPGRGAPAPAGDAKAAPATAAPAAPAAATPTPA
jgi:hypothetical protein